MAKSVKSRILSAESHFSTALFNLSRLDSLVGARNPASSLEHVMVILKCARLACVELKYLERHFEAQLKRKGARK